MVYYRNQIRVPHLKGDRFYSTLAFCFTCEDDDDTVYFAHCYPYTYTDLQVKPLSGRRRLGQEQGNICVCRVHMA